MARPRPRQVGRRPRQTAELPFCFMRRCAALLALLVLALPAPVALAQSQDNPFGPLPEPAPAPVETATPEPTKTAQAQEDTDRRLLFGIGGALIVLFVVIARFITRDARRTLGETAGPERQRRDQGPHRHARQSKAKARARTKAQRRARRQQRR